MSVAEINPIQHGINEAYVVVIISLLLFYCNNIWTLKLLVPKSARTSSRQEWKWRNIANSLIHSLITGCGACVCFYQNSEIRKDLISKWTTSSHCLLAISTGYFIYDMLDMMINDPKSKTYELIVHHVLVISCFTVAITTYNYEGYGIMALFVEVNSVFLHIRQLMIIQNWDRKTFSYRLNSSLNLGTFVVFRILTMGWMTRWLVQHRYDLTPFAFHLAGVITVATVSFPHYLSIAAVQLYLFGDLSKLFSILCYFLMWCVPALAVIMVMNIVLLQRVLKSDYQQGPQQPLTNPELLHRKAS